MTWKPPIPTQDGLWGALERFQPTPAPKPAQKLGPPRAAPTPAPRPSPTRTSEDAGQTQRMWALKRRIVVLMDTGLTYHAARQQAIRELWPDEFGPS